MIDNYHLSFDSSIQPQYIGLIGETLDYIGDSLAWASRSHQFALLADSTVASFGKFPSPGLRVSDEMFPVRSHGRFLDPSALDNSGFHTGEDPPN